VNNNHHIPQDALQTDNGIQVEPPTLNEIKEAIKTQKSHKAPGKDGIPAELLKRGGESLMQTLHRLICKIWNEEEMPCDWRNSIICPIYKKGDKLMCENYRGISLLSTTYKILTYIIQERLEPIAEQVIREYQAGFRKGRSTMDHIFTMKQISEKFWEHNVDLFQIYIDRPMTILTEKSYMKPCSIFIYQLNSLDC
jgi:hypothetical protein